MREREKWREQYRGKGSGGGYGLRERRVAGKEWEKEEKEERNEGEVLLFVLF